MKKKIEAFEGKRVIIRTMDAGVHYGTLLAKEGNEVTLGDSRRIWYWSGAASLSELAKSGVSRPSECKFTVRLEKITVLGVIEILPCTENAIKSIEGVPEWTAR